MINHFRMFYNFKTFIFSKSKANSIAIFSKLMEYWYNYFSYASHLLEIYCGHTIRPALVLPDFLNARKAQGVPGSVRVTFCDFRGSNLKQNDSSRELTQFVLKNNH